MILVTGGMGFIGLHVIKRLLAAGYGAVATRFRTSRTPDFLRDELGRRVVVETLDVADPVEMLDVFRRHEIQSVIHLASPRWGERVFSRDIKTNVVGLTNVLEGARMFGARRVVVASSIDVYAGLGAGPYTEDARLPTEAGSHVSAYKKVAEQIAVQFAEQTGTEVAMARIGVVYGPLYRSLLNLPSHICTAIATGQWPAGGSAGSRFPRLFSDFCYVSDCAAGLALLATAGDLDQRIFNIGAGSGADASEITSAASSLGLGDGGMRHLSSEVPTDSSAYMDVGLARTRLGYTPEYDLRSGMAEYVDWMRSQGTA